MSSHIQFINSEEQLFYSSVYETVKEFTRISECYKQTKRILVFLPVIPRARFLIHKCAELFPTLSSVSIGKGIFRRVVLYFEQYPSPHLQQIKKQKRDQRYNGLELKLFEMSSPPRARSKRPDQAIYVPKRRINVSAKDTKNESQTEKTDAKDTKKVLQKERTEKSLRPVSEKPTCKITDVKKEAQSNLSKDDIKVEKLAAKLDHLNLKENFVEKHIITTKSTEAIAQKMSEEILHSIFDVLPSKLSRLKAMQNNERQRVVHVQQAHVKLEEMLLPGMATNFVNLAIENALELIKSVKKYESRVPVCTRNEGLLKFANKCSKQILVESIQDNLRCNEEKPSDSVIEKSEGLINSKQDDLDIEESENLKTDGDKCKDEVGDKNNDKDVKCDKKTKVIETPPSQKTRTANTSKKGKATKNKKTKNKNNKDTMDSTEKVSKNEKPVKYGNKVKKVKKNNVEPVSDKEEKDLVETRNQLKTTVDKTKLKDSTAENREEEEDDWDANWTEDGECLNENMLQELSSLTGITNPTVEKAEGIDYLNFTPTKQIELDAGEFGHILELFDFSPNQKTQEIFNILSSAGIKDINLTWVDDTHALAVFASQAAAHNALKQNIPVLQMRQVVNGTRESKAKARDFKDSLLPYKKRPASTGMVARNLVAGALGIRTNVSSEQRKKERELLKEAREERRMKKKKKIDVWENPE